MSVRFINAALLASVSRDAASRPRLRANFNFHPGDDFPAHRLLNAIEPGSWLPPHRHLDPAKDETIIVLAGALGAVIFDDGGVVVSSRRLDAGGDCCGVDIPHGTWHTVLALVPGTVLFEAKSGPYRPLSAEELAPWAPGEGAPEVAAYAESLRRLFVGR
jgi:cupin fold WbuC family metalloprotein